MISIKILSLVNMFSEYSSCILFAFSGTAYNVLKETFLPDERFVFIKSPVTEVTYCCLHCVLSASIDVIEALCDALGVSLREFFDVNTRLQDMKDTLWDEIAKLNPKQRELLKAFLSSMNSPDQLS